jgi:septal ring factor EnvC (AmiA/AmiB activator)
MNLFLKLLPYLIILALGFSIYFGFRHYESKISQLTTDYTCVVNENNSLKEEIASLKEINNITTEQLQNIQKQVYESVTYVTDTSNKIDSLKLDEDKEILIGKINAYEICVAKNSRDPSIKCKMEFE